MTSRIIFALIIMIVTGNCSAMDKQLATKQQRQETEKLLRMTTKQGTTLWSILNTSSDKSFEDFVEEHKNHLEPHHYDIMRARVSKVRNPWLAKIFNEKIKHSDPLHLSVPVKVSIVTMLFTIPLNVILLGARYVVPNVIPQKIYDHPWLTAAVTIGLPAAALIGKLNIESIQHSLYWNRESREKMQEVIKKYGEINKSSIK